MKKLLPYILSLFFLDVEAQQPGKEAWHWYFGNKCGIDFSSGVPISIPGIPNSYFSGGCASISDVNTGQYLFTIGSNKIYGKNNTVMYNGYNIFAGNLNSQDLIVQQPGNPNIYYVFTPDIAVLNGHGVCYSVVDLNQQGGLGAVTTKNKQLLKPPATEKVVGVRHCNGVDYWVLLHPGNSNAFHAYKITSTGLDTTPVISNVGVAHQFKHTNNFSYFEGMGCLKASPNGKKLASAIQSDSIPLLEIFDFDNSTGVVSNSIPIFYPGKVGPYGTSFSPDNSKLYAIPYNNMSTWDSSMVYQYDLSSGVPATIVASQTLIYLDTLFVNLSELQIGPDGKIYIDRYGTDTLAVINNPNNSGIACNFQFKSIAVANNSIGIWGLPNFIDANYAGIQLNLPDVKQCTVFNPVTLDAGSGFANYFWSTGASTQTIVINGPGKYWVTISNGVGCTRTDTMQAYFINPGKKNINACVADTENTIQSIVLSYNWSDGTTNPINTFTASGIYWEDISFVGGCTVRDSFIVTVNPNPVVDLGRDTMFCKGNLSLNAFNPNSIYIWSTGATSSSIAATTAGTYWVKVKDANGCVDGDTLVVHPELTVFSFAMPNVVTPNNDNINDVIDFGKYQFSSLQIEIYNRWGIKVSEGSDPNFIWKPTGDEGTYFYTGQYKIDCGTDSQTKNLKGYITLIR